MATKAPAKRKPAAKRPATKKAATKRATPKKAAKRVAPAKAPAKKAAAKAPAKKPAFGRPGTAGKGEGDAAVQAWLAGVKPQHRAIVERVDALMGEHIPDVKRAVKWSTPMYGREGQGWIASVASFKEHVAVRFFNGIELRPAPPEGESERMRGFRVHDMGELDERQLRSWIQQASKLQGWGKA